MDSRALRYRNVGRKERKFVDYRIALRTLRLLIAAESRALRKEKGLLPSDAFYNMLKMVNLQKILLRRRYMVRFGDLVVLDATFPPFPSPAYDKRVANHLNNLNMTALPPGIVSISATSQCPYSCGICSTDSRHNGDGDVDEEILKKTISQIERLGTSLIILHGGEPMAQYDRFLRIVKHVSNETCLWMFTTGHDVTPQRAMELKASGLFGVWVSLDHYDPKEHNRLRGNGQAFQNACSAVESFNRAGIYTCLSVVPQGEMLEPDHFKKYYEMARELGVAEVRVMEVKPSGRGACLGPIPHSPVMERLQQDLFRDPQYCDYPPLSGLSTWLEKDRAMGCQCRFEYLYISAAGDVQPCEVTELSFGNVREEDFLDIYERACKAFQHPSTGCIPMVMYQEVRDYHEIKDRLTSEERSELATKIVREFQSRGTIPGVYQPIWDRYLERLSAYLKRKNGQL